MEGGILGGWSRDREGDCKGAAAGGGGGRGGSDTVLSQYCGVNNTLTSLPGIDCSPTHMVEVQSAIWKHFLHECLMVKFHTFVTLFNNKKNKDK